METLEASSNADHEMKTSDEEQNQEHIRCVHLFNCDKTYKLDAVKKLFESFKECPLRTKLNFAFSVKCHDFALRDMSQVCENIIPGQIKVDDVAVFVVHAHESRLSINEDNAGIGYAKIYKALLKATGGKVLVVIGGDDSYKDSAEEQGSFLSRWARRKVSSQFSGEFLDGRKSFIFSWDKEHRPIHEEALLHYFDPGKKNKKFVPEEKVAVTVSQEDPEQSTGKELQQITPCMEEQGAQTQNVAPEKKYQGGRDTDANGCETEVKSSDIPKETEGQMGQTGQEQASVQYSPTDEEGLRSFEYLPYPNMEQEEDDYVKESEDPPVIITHADVPEHEQPMDTRSSSLQARIAILYRDQSDIASIEDVFGDIFRCVSSITEKNPHTMKERLLSSSVRSCFIIVESLKMKEELLKKSNGTLYQDLLRAASMKVEKKTVVILCNKEGDLSRSEEESITAKIEKLLDEKGIIVWWKGNNKTRRSILKRSQSLPAPACSIKKSTKTDLPTPAEHPINPKEFTLVFKTRLRRGRISYDKNDVEVKMKEWKVPQKMADDLFEKWQSTDNAELKIYRENSTGDERTVVTEDLETKVSRLEEGIKEVWQGVGARVTSLKDASIPVMATIRSFVSGDSCPDGGSKASPANTDPELLPD